MLSKDASVKLYQAVVDAREERNLEHWHASSIAECPRTHYFKRLGVPPLETPSAAKIMRWDAGHAYEERFRPLLRNLYPDSKISSNVRLTYKGLDLTGEYDNYNHELQRLVEVKTVHDYAFKEQDGVVGLKEQIGNHPNGNKMWGVKETPYLHHELQNHAYVLLLAEQGEEVKGIDYVYISLSGRIVVYQTEVQQSLLDNVKSRLEVLNKAWGAQTPPDCICREGHPLYDSVMQWCPYKAEGGCCSLELITEAHNKTHGEEY